MEIRLGLVIHYYGRIQVAVIEVLEEIKIGDRIWFDGVTTDFEQSISSIQIDHKPVMKAAPGMEIALKVTERVRKGDNIFKIKEAEQAS